MFKPLILQIFRNLAGERMEYRLSFARLLRSGALPEGTQSDLPRNERGPRS